MTEFYYKARDIEGKLIQGSLNVPSQKDAENVLKNKRLFILELTNRNLEKNSYRLFSKAKASNKDLSAFSYQVAAMLKAGLPLLAVLEISARKTPPVFKSAIEEVMEDLKKGENLALAMMSQNQVFPPLMIGMVEAGEMGGVLEEVFDWLASHYEKEEQLQQKIISSLIYPFLLFILTIGALILLLSFVVPNFSDMLQGMGASLPVLTAKILGLSHFLAQWGFYLVLFFLLLLVALFSYFQTGKGRLIWDSCYLKMPLIGDLFIKVISSRFCHVLGTLLDEGVPILSALEVTKKTINNSLLSSGLSHAQASLKEGKQLTEPLKKLEVFPDLLLKMIEVGEATGQVSQFLLKLNDYFDREVAKTLDRITKLIEPILILVMGGLIGIIIIALMLPLFNILDAF